MREIKFRVWSTYHKKHFTLQESANYGNIMPRGNELQLTTNYELILEQYTGLKDKNGVEIYDGDYIQLHKDYRLASRKIYKEGVVKWHKYGYWCVVLKKNLNDYRYYNRPIWDFPLDSYEVIGNMYNDS